MKQYKKSYELKNAAKNKLDGKYGSAVLILFLNSLISGAAGFFVSVIASSTMYTAYATSGSAGASTAVSFVFDAILLVVNIILGVMNAGITLNFLNMACDRPFSLRDLFYGFKTDSKNILIISGATVLCQTICLWPYQYLLQKFMDSRDEKWLLYALVAMVIGLCIYVPVSLGIAMSFYLMFDFPQNSGKETLALSWRVMKGHRGRLFYLELSFLPLMLLCVLSFGIGFLWLQPYMQMTYTYFFLDLMNPNS